MSRRRLFPEAAGATIPLGAPFDQKGDERNGQEDAAYDIHTVDALQGDLVRTGVSIKIQLSRIRHRFELNDGVSPETKIDL